MTGIPTRPRSSPAAWDGSALALGLPELLDAAHRDERPRHGRQEALLRAHGAREIGTGLGILLSRDATPWIWGRVAGDGLDLATLAPAAAPDSPKQLNGIAAALFVAAVTTVDVLCVAGLSQRQLRRRRSAERDYSNRSGFPYPPETMRGRARDAAIPRDMRTPEAMRPYTSASRPEGGAAWTTEPVSRPAG